ncbi:extracellular alpha-1 4-glucan glucosidase [Fusarium beomiforme]|uniref:Extracellular alpha-1 4-glucan glucosidase n=1 Tax=Fusarium beomiforme TaxID=44412 RepID=A0A9P5AII1_9HYPO|nr:extracellular alpha-1 4-glucan glucosidase [Fusarium beomiforme]
MRPPNIPVVAALSAFPLLSCLLSSVSGLVHQQCPGPCKVVRSNNLIEARKAMGHVLADGYGPPPLYYTEESMAPTDMTSYSSMERSTATETQNESSEAGVTSVSNVSSHYDTVSSGSSSRFVSSALETNSAMITVGSSVKAGSMSSSNALSSVDLTVSSSFLGTETSGTEFSSMSLDHASTFSDDNSTMSGTYPSAGTSALETPTESSSGSVSSTTMSDFHNTASEKASRDQTISGVETSDEVTRTEPSSSHESSATKIKSTSTTTTMVNIALTVSAAESTAFSLTSLSTNLPQANKTSVLSSQTGVSSRLSSSTVLETADETMTITVIPQHSWSQLSTEDLATPTDSEEQQASGGLVTDSTGTTATQSNSADISFPKSAQEPSVALSIPTNGSVSFTTTTAYFTTTLGVPVSSYSLSNSSSSPSTTVITSGDSSGAGIGGSSAIVVSRTVPLSTTLTTSKTYTAFNFTSPVTDTFPSSVPTSILSSSIGSSESELATAPVRSLSETPIASTGLPINATSGAVTSSFAVVTFSEGSLITTFPGGIIPTGSITSLANSSVSTEYSTSTPSRFNLSTSVMRSSLSSHTSPLFEWPTSTLTGSQTSGATLEVPSLSFPTSWLSIITTPMTPPSVSTTPTRSPSGGSAPGNRTMIRTTMTSTITSSLTPTQTASTGNVTAAHTTSGYNFSETLGAGTNTFNSWSSSFASSPGISTIIITGQPTNLPFPTNTTVGWRSSSSMSWSGSNKTISAQGSDTTSSLTTAGFNSTAPYINSTTNTGGETFPSSPRSETPSIVTTEAFGSWNTTSTGGWFTNSTNQATVTATSTVPNLSAGTQTLNDSAVITSLNVTLTTISGSIYTKTFTDVTITIMTQTFSVTSGSNTLSTIVPSRPPFTFPSNTTVTVTGASLPLSGTGARSTITSPSGELSTPPTPSIRTTYRTLNTTFTETTTGASAFAAGTNEPLFPVSNSTAQGIATSSSIVSWRPDPEPWTTWLTLSLTNELGPSTWSTDSEVLESTSYTGTTTVTRTTTLEEPSTLSSSIHNLSSGASESTSYTRTTTLHLTTTLAEPSAFQSTISNVSSGSSQSIPYARTTTVTRTTTLEEPSTSQFASGNSTGGASLSISYTSTTALTLTTTLEEPSISQVSGATATNSSVSTWSNTTSGLTDFARTETLSLATIVLSISGTLTTFLTTGSAKGALTSLESSALTPLHASNSTLSQFSGRTSSTVDTRTDTYILTGSAQTATPCESTSTSSSSCTDSVYDASAPTAIPPSTDCLTAAGGSASSWSNLSATSHVLSTCNTKGSMSCNSTAHWSSMTHTFGVKDTDTSTYQPLTTLRTVTKERAEESGSAGDDCPTPTDRVPEDPNFPWGNDSPIHRHQNSSELGVGTGEGDGDGGLNKKVD